MAFSVPIMDTTRARDELGWEPKKTAEDAFRELLEGMRAGEGEGTPPLRPGGAGPLRIKEILSGIGGRNP